jgi:serine/threonine-protein kinase
MLLSIGQVIRGRYRIAALLGQGGMGDVYRAWDLNLKIPVAVKVNLETTVESQEQFQVEARILARLSHPNLPRVTDYFTVPGGGEYLVMDYVEGQDLDSLLEAASAAGGQAFPGQAGVIQVVLWMKQVGEALVYLHSQAPPVIHRDIKPANIKITPAGRAILVDFGIAKHYEPDLATVSGARAVTPGYSPPEQYGGASTDARSDIYALGATLYHLLTGQQPPESVQRLAGNAPLLAPAQLNPAIGPGLEQVILKAMALPMERRYQNAAELLVALEQAMVENARPRPAPVPVDPLPRRASAPPPHPPGFLSQNLPYFILGGVLLVVIALVIARLVINAGGAAPSQPPPAPTTTPQPTATSAIDVLVAKDAATRTALAQRQTTPLPTTSDATPAIPIFTRRLFDNFNSKTQDWFTGIDNNLACWIAGGRYTCQAQAGQAVNYFQWLDDFALPAEFVLSTDAWPGPERPRGMGDANTGLVFRATDQGRYLFSVRNDGYFRLSSVQSEPANWVDLLPWQRSDAIRRGQDNRLLVSGRGAHYDLFINGQFVGSVDDPTWVAGFPGLHLFTAPGEKPPIVEFDNFLLQTP